MQQTPSLFDLLTLSLGNAALIALGLVNDPDSKTAHLDLNSAQYNIELLEMLKLKTINNLSSSESELLNQLIYDLQLKFVDAKKKA